MTYFIPFYLHVQCHGKLLRKLKILTREEPLAQVSVAAEKSTEDPLPSIDAICPITGKYLINYI